MFFTLSLILYAIKVLEEMDKRAAMGFQGMRGKKMYVDVYPHEGGDKRAMSMGFQGMRGKREDYATGDDWDKRAPMGFQGMRGKKSLIDQISELEKRAIMGIQVYMRRYYIYCFAMNIIIFLSNFFYMKYIYSSLGVKLRGGSLIMIFSSL